MSKQLVYESESNESIIVYCFTKFELQRCIVYTGNHNVIVNQPCILRSEHIEYYHFPSTRLYLLI